MRKAFVELFNTLIGDKDGYILDDISEMDSHEIIDGKLISNTMRPIIIKRGIPIWNSDCESNGNFRDEEQIKTNTTFSDKWRKLTNYGFAEEQKNLLLNWYCKKMGMNSIEDLKFFYSKKERILEVGTGSGFNCKFMGENTNGYVVGVDISDGIFTTYENTKELSNVYHLQADLMKLPFKKDTFDFIIADGVLHHTPNTKEAVFKLYDMLSKNGQFFFYIYKKMSPVKQFVDQYIREEFSSLTPEECFEACKPLTELGHELSKLDAKVTLEKPIPILGIPAGTHNVQRLLYYNFVKCFWSDVYDYETNNMINFDWYHPHNAWQHTVEEVQEWMRELKVSQYDIFDANPNGISVLLTK